MFGGILGVFWGDVGGIFCGVLEGFLYYFWRFLGVTIMENAIRKKRTNKIIYSLAEEARL